MARPPDDIEQRHLASLRADAEYLARRVGRLDPRLLYGIQHRGEAAPADVAVVRSRAVLVQTRTQLITHARGV